MKQRVVLYFREIGGDVVLKLGTRLINKSERAKSPSQKHPSVECFQGLRLRHSTTQRNKNLTVHSIRSDVVEAARILTS